MTMESSPLTSEGMDDEEHSMDISHIDDDQHERETEEVNQKADEKPKETEKRGSKKSAGSVFDKYEVMTILGGSENSGVYLCRMKQKQKSSYLNQLFNRKDEEEQLFVMKVLRIDTVGPNLEESNMAAQNFFDTMDSVMEIRHPNMVKIYEYYERYDKAYLIQEYLRGGNLAARCPFSETEAAHIVSRILSAIKCMHDKGFLHLSLNLENILYTDDAHNADVKLADFGFSRRMKKVLTHVRHDGGEEKNYATAPEIFKGLSSPQSDLWSIGVITYVLLSRLAPFRGDTMMEQITRCRFNFDDPVWSQISKDGKNFISSLLRLDPNSRPGLAKIMKHRWLTRRVAVWRSEVDFMTEEEHQLMDHALRVTRFKIKAINIMAEVSSMEEILKIAHMCIRFDDSKSGLTTFSEFKLALQTVGYSQGEIGNIFSESDFDGEAPFEFLDFLAATLEARGRFEEIILTEAFERMFPGEDYMMSEYELAGLLTHVGTPGRSAELFPEADWDGDEKVSFKEFLHAFYRKTREFSSRIAVSPNYSITNVVTINSLRVLREDASAAPIAKYRKHGILGGSDVSAVYIVRLDNTLDVDQDGARFGIRNFLKRLGDNKIRGDVEARCEYAMKTYKGTTPEAENKIRAEIDVLMSMKHRNIVKIYDSFQDYGQVHIVMEYCDGGNLASRLPFSESEAARIVWKLLSATKHMHDRGIKHSSINMETIVFVDGSKDSEIKLINFGLTRKYMNHERFSPEMNDPGLYAASPESFRGVYTKKGDIWSVGIVAYCLLSNFKPFWGKRWQEKIMHGEYDFDYEAWDLISTDGIDFVSSLLQVDAGKRPDAGRAMRIAWQRNRGLINRKDRNSSEDNEAVERALRDADFKRVALNVIAQRLSDDQIIGLLETALAYDENKVGVMTHAEFKEMLKAQDFTHVVEGISLKTKDFEQVGSINVFEFLNATLAARGHILEDLYTEEFRNSENDSGYILREKLVEMLEATGAAIGVEDIFVEAGLDPTEDYIAFEEFLKVFRKLHTRTVSSRIRADLVSMTTAVVGGAKVSDQGGPSLSVYSRFELTNRLGGSETIVFEVIPRGMREAELSRVNQLNNNWSPDIVSPRRSHDADSLRKVSSMEFEYALKIFRLNKHTSMIAKKVSLELKAEISLIENLDHPNIAMVHEVSQHFDHIHVITELCRGGNLGTHFPYTEAEVARIIRMILSALEYMHAQRVLHRALNLENVLFETEGELSDIKLINYGLSRKFIKSERQLVSDGEWSKLYAVPPEGFRGVWGPRGDMWSVGVIAYTMLAGHLPFRGDDMIQRIERCDYDFDHPIWKERSRHSQTFVASLLKLDAAKRVDARRALRHPWFKQTFEFGGRPPYVEDDAESQAFEEERRDVLFRTDAINALAFNSIAKDIMALRNVLDGMTRRKWGVAAYSDFKRALQKSGYSSDLVARVFHNVDLSKHGEFDYADFLDRALQAKGYMMEVKLAEAFDSMDSRQEGFVTRDLIMSLIGGSYESLRVDEIFHSIGEDEKVSFQDFLHLFDRHMESFRKKNFEETSKAHAAKEGEEEALNGSRLFSFRVKKRSKSSL